MVMVLSGATTGIVVSLLIAFSQKTFYIFYYRITAWMSVFISMLRPKASIFYHVVKKIKSSIISVINRITMAARLRQLKAGTTHIKDTYSPGTAQPINETIKVLLDVDYSLYIHHIFTVWVLYFIFFCIIVFTTFRGSRAIYALCIRHWITGPIHFFVRKYVFYNKFFIYNTTIRILDFSYASSFKLLDKGLFEISGPYGAINTISKVSRRVTVMQTGLLYHNTGILILGALFLLMFGSVFLYIWMNPNS